jgi:N-acyl-D-amino-acid deacylase
VTVGEADERLASLDRMMQSFMERFHVPGAALAVTAQSRLVHARGYGYADLAAREQVSPQTLFRIASISKPITAVATLQLVEQGRLSLDDRVFEILEGKDIVDDRQRSITIRQLLQHTGGWDRDASFDPMFQAVRIARTQGVPPPARPEDIIRFMLGQPLDFSPGEKYAYSNYGYCLLGRVIEKISGQDYESYVKEHVLEPLGIHTMRLGVTRLPALPGSGEARYYDPNPGRSVFSADLDQPVASPYGAWCLESMDSHGGWIASAIDLARFATAFDSPEKCPILKPGSIETMFSRPSVMTADPRGQDVYYGCGWNVRTLADGGGFNAWHTGSLPGTATILVRRHDGLNWAVLLNARQSGDVGHLTQQIDPLVHAAADEVSQWPTRDLFERY